MSVDRTRRFSLPGIQDLNKDQDAALALPLEGQNLIIGGPGTGKSVVALLRARRFVEDKKKYQFLVYNHMLDNSNRHLFGSQQTLCSRTWDQWFRELWKEYFHADIPTLESQNKSIYRPIDWQVVSQRMHALPRDAGELREPPSLVIDEGQDMPPAFYEALINLGFENFYIVADQNQQIFPDKCSSRADIENVMNLSPPDTLELRTNYRNSLPIARLAQHFYREDPASARPDLPDRASPLTPLLVRYGDNGGVAFGRIVERILQRSDQNPRKLIGIITPNGAVRQKFYDELCAASPRLDNGKPPIRTYVPGEGQRIDFGQGGIAVINAQSCKGLEFDIVFLADIDLHQPKNDPRALMARFYVMVTRAREQVILLRTGNVCPVVEGILPTDPNILSGNRS